MNEFKDIIQVIMYLIVSLVMGLGISKAKDWKKKPPKLPIEVHLSDDVKEDIDNIRKVVEQIEVNTRKVPDNSDPKIQTTSLS